MPAEISPFIAKAKADALLAFAKQAEGAAKEWRGLATIFPNHEDAIENRHRADALEWCAERMRETAAQYTAAP